MLLVVFEELCSEHGHLDVLWNGELMSQPSRRQHAGCPCVLQQIYMYEVGFITQWIVPHVLILSNQIAGIYLLRYRTYHRRHVVITSVKLKQ